MIKAYLRGEQEHWNLNLGCLAAVYRATPHASTGLTPNLVMLGREVRLPGEIMYGSGTKFTGEQITSYGEYVDKLRERMQKSHEVARKHLNASAEYQRQHYDAKISHTQYKTGDYVWYQTDISQLHITPKLRVAYEGPYLIIQKIGDLDYQIQLNQEGTVKIVHHNRLKPYKGDNLLKWAKSALSKLKKK